MICFTLSILYLGNKIHDRFNSLLTYQRYSITESSCHIWENLVRNRLVGYMIDESRHILEQTNADCAIWRGKHSNDRRDDDRLQFILGQMLGNFKNSAKCFCAACGFRVSYYCPDRKEMFGSYIT